MLDSAKSKERLLEDVQALRARLAELERARAVSLEIEENLRLDQEEVHAFSERLAALVEIGGALTHAETLDSLCRQAVELAGWRLQFGCLSLRMRGPSGDTLHGAYCMDCGGHVADEHETLTVVPPQSAEMRVLRGRESFVVETNVAVQDGSELRDALMSVSPRSLIVDVRRCIQMFGSRCNVATDGRNE